MKRLVGRMLVWGLAAIMLLGAFAVPAGAASNTWRGEYYDNGGLVGAPKVVREDPGVDFDWGTGTPDYRIPADRFSVRWTRTVWFDTGTYRFGTETDDGVRLYVDGQLIIDRWLEQSRMTHWGERYLTAGEHTVRMEYYENTGLAVARMGWLRLGGQPSASATWRAEYFANRSLSGAPSMVRDETKIGHDWGAGSPHSAVPSDSFSARWTRNISFNGGRYRFTTETDDGVRLYVDGQLVIDHWYDMARARHQTTVNLTEGVHTIRMEYYENNGFAYASLGWEELMVPTKGNIVTCVRPRDSWIKVYRMGPEGWIDINPRGYGALSERGDLKLDGMPVDVATYGDAGHPYRVELWAGGKLIRSVGNTDIGQPAWRVRAGADSYTPWGCPAP